MAVFAGMLMNVIQPVFKMLNFSLRLDVVNVSLSLSLEHQ
jgi:hypothetical protein